VKPFDYTRPPSVKAALDALGSVHAVEAAQYGRLAASGRPDHGGDPVLAEVHVDFADGLVAAVED
jgi:hypothetical protein